MMADDEDANDPDTMRRNGMRLIESFAPLREMLAGYRAALMSEQGFSQEIADACAVQLHGVFMAQAELQLRSDSEIATATKIAEIRRTAR